MQLLFDDCELLHIRNFLRHFLYKCVDLFSLWSFGVAFSDSYPELFRYSHFRYLSFQLLCSLCLYIEHSLVFLKYFVILSILACFFVFMRFFFMVRYLNSSSAFSFTHMSALFLFSCWSAHFFSFCRISFSFLVDFLLIFLLWISFDVQARICFGYLICFSSFCILLLSPF